MIFNTNESNSTGPKKFILLWGAIVVASVFTFWKIAGDKAKKAFRNRWLWIILILIGAGAYYNRKK